MQKAKETASNVAASAKAGMDITKVVVQEKVDKMTAHDPAGKDKATQRKEEGITNAAATGTGGTYSHSATMLSLGGHLIEGMHLAEESNLLYP